MARVDSAPPPGRTSRPPARSWLTGGVAAAIAAELSRLARHLDTTLHWRPLDVDSGAVFDRVRAIDKAEVEDAGELARRLAAAETALVVLNGNLNHRHDAHEQLAELHRLAHRGVRVAAVLYSPYLWPLFALLNALGVRRGGLPDTFLTGVSLRQIARLAGWEVVRVRPVAQFPFRLFGLGTALSRFLRQVPGVRWAGPVAVAVLRPSLPAAGRPSLSVVVPARNEEGNIPRVLPALAGLSDVPLEVLFVEGHSKDGTWEAIQREIAAYRGPIRLAAHRQTGRGKNDAVRLGFAHATGDLLTILDADLTMPGERLREFYDAWCGGHADFVNGSRLVYPMAGGAMRFLNRLGNSFFARAVGFVLETDLSDTLCGTKLVSRAHYRAIQRWREAFGDFDPFGDFELLFPAACLGLGIVDVPVRYEARTYGETNIQRFRHGWQLLGMTLVGLFRVRLGSF